MNRFLCLDSSVFLKWLSAASETDADKAIALVEQSHAEIIAPALAWTEVGSALRKKVRMGLITEAEMDMAWQAFMGLGIRFLQSEPLAQRTWQLARELALPTLYDASFLAAAELAPGGPCTFWTADDELLRRAAGKKSYVRVLADYVHE